ncbi:MAG: DUF3147 family protein [Verrucomicrobiales bacterium]
MSLQLILRALLSGAVIVTVSELAKRNNFAAAIVHSLPLISITALVWLYSDTRDTALVDRHMTGTFFFVLPTLPMFLAVPWLLRRGWTFWPALAAGAALTVVLYLITIRVLRAAGINL